MADIFNLLHSNILATVCHAWKCDIYLSVIVEITGLRTCFFGSHDTADNKLITDKAKQQQSWSYFF